MFLSTKKQLRLDVLYKLESKKLTRKEAQTILNVSERTLRRYIKKYREKGVLSLRHGNQGKAPANRLPENLKEQVMHLVRERYYDFNMLHCLEKLKTNHGLEVKRETFRKWCHEIGCVKRPKKKRSKP